MGFKIGGGLEKLVGKSIFGEADTIGTLPQSKEAIDARKKLVDISEKGVVKSPLRGIAGLPDTTKERELARTTATDLAKPRESFDFATSPEVQGIIARTVEEGNLLANRLGRSLQKSGGFQTTTGRDVLGRTVKEVESNISASLAQFAEAERGRDFADVQRRQNLVPLLETLGLTEESRVQGTEQAKLDALFQQEIGVIGEEERLIRLLRSIISDQPGSFIQEAAPSILEQAAAVGQAAAPFIAASDETIKEDIESIANALDLVNQLDGKTFKFIDGPKSGGIIAQDLEKIMPDMVTNVDGIKVVDYTSVIGLLVNAVKELSKKVT